VPTWLVPLLITLDQITKLWAQRHLDPVPDPFLPGLYLTYTKNTGAAFGILQGNSAWLGWASLLVGMAILFFLSAARPRALLTQLSLSFIAAGALGNAVDRIGRGYVVDYLDIGPGLWPIFNLADSLVVAGVAILLLEGMLARRRRS